MTLLQKKWIHLFLVAFVLLVFVILNLFDYNGFKKINFSGENTEKQIDDSYDVNSKCNNADPKKVMLTCYHFEDFKN